MDQQHYLTILEGFLGVVGLGIAAWVANSIDKMRSSVEELNTKIAVVISRTDNHEQRLNKLEDKI
jgi:hypothetical protein